MSFTTKVKICRLQEDLVKLIGSIVENSTDSNIQCVFDNEIHSFKVSKLSLFLASPVIRQILTSNTTTFIEDEVNFIFEEKKEIVQLFISYVTTGVAQCRSIEEYRDLESLLTNLSVINNSKDSIHSIQENEEENNIYLNRKVTESHPCQRCGKEFATSVERTEHKKENPNEPWCCLKCNYQFTKHSDLAFHKIVHAYNGDVIKDTINCHICGKLLTNQSSRRRHMLLHSDPTGISVKKKKKEPHTCEHCGKVLSSKDSYTVHIKTMHTHSEKDVECGVCSKKFKTKYGLATHSAVHDPNAKKFMCEVCGFAAKTSSVLKCHVASHESKRKFQCTKCEKSYPVKTMLSHHLSTAHSESRPFICSECGKSFKLSNQMKTHVKKVHFPNKKILCSLCSYRCSSMSDMQLHLIVHSETKPFICSECGDEFKHKEEGRRHIKSQHKDLTEVKIKFEINDAISRLLENVVQFLEQ